VNRVFPLERLRELAAGKVGRVARLYLGTMGHAGSALHNTRRPSLTSDGRRFFDWVRT